MSYPRGFQAAGVVAGIKASGRPGVAVVAAADGAVPAAAVFTRSTMAAPPVVLSRRHIEAAGRVRAVVVTSGNANAATGAVGMRDAERMTELVAKRLGSDVTEVLVASTGVIGVCLPMERVQAGISAALDALVVDGGAAAAEAILTTDAAPKIAEREILIGDRAVRVGGMAKGAGMIRPDLGTMIAVVTTDAVLSSTEAAAVLRDAVAESFNCITVDGCASTSDTVILLANGASRITLDTAGYTAVSAAVRDVCCDLALQIVCDGEGAKRIARWEVVGAANNDDAKVIAYAVAEAQLVRCALHGGDPNWGRIIAAVGGVGRTVDPNRIAITLGGNLLCSGGIAVCDVDTAAVAAAAALDTVEVTIDLGLGCGRAVVWGSDLSLAYVAFNVEYTT